MERASPTSGMSIFFELATKTVMDVVRFMHRQQHPQSITSSGGPASPISKTSKKRRSGRKTFLQRILRTARKYAVEYIRVPAPSNIIGFIKTATTKQPPQQTEKLQKLELELSRLRDEINRLMVPKQDKADDSKEQKEQKDDVPTPSAPPPPPLIPQGSRIPAPPPPPSRKRAAADTVSEPTAAPVQSDTIVAPNMLTRRKLPAASSQSSTSLTELLTSGKTVPLRKVEVQRSPGGTPMKDNARSDPTLYLALALKRKFKHVYASPDEKPSPDTQQRRRRDSFFDDDEGESSPQTQPSRPVTIATTARAAPGIVAAVENGNNTPTKPGSPVSAPLHRTRRQSVVSSPQQVRRANTATAAVAPAPATPIVDKENHMESANVVSEATPSKHEGVDNLPKMSVSELKRRLQSQNSGLFQKGSSATTAPSNKRV